MRSMSRVERFFERLVERPQVDPALKAEVYRQVLRRIERAMESGREVRDGRDVAPDRFSVRLNPADLADLGDPEVRLLEVASGALTFARSHDLTLIERPRVSIQPDEGVVRGEVDVQARISAPIAADAEADSGTRVFEVPVPRAPKVVLEVREPGRLTRNVPVTGPLRIGRAAECEIALRDPRVSRQHARVHAREGHLVLTDLGSTNGTMVNGHRISEVVLGAGDRIELGETSLVIQAAPTEPAARR